MRRLLYGVPVAVFVVVVGYFGQALWSGRDPHELPSALIDKKLPEFVLPALDGGAPVTSAALAGQPFLLNFFASWCVPCRLEHPLLLRLAAKYQVPIIGIAYKDAEADSRRELARLGDPYRRIGVDRQGGVGFDFGVYGVPETYVVDRAGHIRKRFVGPLTADAVDREVLPLLRELGRP